MRTIGRSLPVIAAAAATFVLALAAFAPAPAFAAAPTSGVARENDGPSSGVTTENTAPPPQLILLHGGSFLFEDPYFEPLTRERAIAAGFEPHYLTYPLGNLPAAVTAARLEARRLREKFGVGRVYAYGASAGGTLAAILAGEGDVSAAVAKAPVSDLATWEWPLGQYGPNYYETIAADPTVRVRLSPYNRREERPLLVIQGRADGVVPLAMNEAFAAKFPRVHLWVVAGGHTTDRVRPYLISRAMRWLAEIAHRTALEEGGREAGRLP